VSGCLDGPDAVRRPAPASGTANAPQPQCGHGQFQTRSAGCPRASGMARIGRNACTVTLGGGHGLRTV